MKGSGGEKRGVCGGGVDAEGTWRVGRNEANEGKERKGM